MSRILCLDIGSRRIGVAISDYTCTIAQSLETILCDDTDLGWLDRLDKLAQEHEVTSFVIGLPRNMNGTLGPKAQEAQRLAEVLQTRYSLPVVLWDERLSSVAVERVLISADLSRKKRKKKIDKVAAAWILQGFLDSRQYKGEK